MLVKLQFDEDSYDITDIPKSLMDWYVEHKFEFYNRLKILFRKQGSKNYMNGFYYYAGVEVIEWLNTDLLKDKGEKVEIISFDKLDPADDGLPVMRF